MIKIAILLLLLTSLTNCKWFTNIDTTFLAGTNFKIPDGTPNFQDGFKEGCALGLFTRGNGYYRSKYGGKWDNIDYNRFHDNEYHFGLKRGYAYCFVYVIKHVGDGADDYIVGKSAFDWSSSSINQTVTASGENLGFGINQTAINSPRGLSGSLDFITQGKGAGGTGKGALSSHIFWGSTNKNFGGWW